MPNKRGRMLSALGCHESDDDLLADSQEGMKLRIMLDSESFFEPALTLRVGW